MFGDMPDEVISSYENEYMYGGDYSGGGGSSFCKDRLYYHTSVDNLKIEAETEKAYLFRDEHGIYWMPKKLVRGLGNSETPGRKACYIHRVTYHDRNYLKE